MEPLDPQIVAARRRQAASMAAVDVTRLPPAEGRDFANKAALFFHDGQPEIARVADIELPGGDGPLRARLYEPQARPPGAVFYLHGGGWFHCNVDTHDRLMRVLARESGLAVIGIDYRLAPEHPFPAGLDDARAAWRAVPAALGLDPANIAVAGDSAGANIALALCLSERDAGGVLPGALALFYGCFAPRFDTESHKANGDGRFGLTTERMRWYWRNYVADLAAPPPLSAPLGGDLHGLPPTYLCLAERDPIADDTRLLARNLAAAAVPHTLISWPGASHGFLQMTRDVALAREAASDAAGFLAARLTPSSGRH